MDIGFWGTPRGVVAGSTEAASPHGMRRVPARQS